MSKTIIIAGGGIGGLAAALALHRAGVNVHVYERQSTFTEAGAGMSLWPNATRILQLMGVLDELMENGEPVTRFNLRRSDGKLISGIRMEGFATPALCLHRADLHRALRRQIPEGSLHSGRRLESFVPDGARVVVRFSGGHEVLADGLIGADGLHSVVRAQLHGSRDPDYRGYCIWRGIAPEALAGPPGHISESWGKGRRFGVLPMGRGRVCWYATCNAAPRQGDAPLGRKAEVQELFRNWHDPIQALVESTPVSAIIKNDARDRRALREWGKGCVTLMGDAAHPITPNVGQGACMAVEDAACLAKCLLGSPDVAGSFRAYEALRRRRTAYVGRQARFIGAVGQWEHPVVVAARDLVTQLVLSCAPDMRRNAVYSYVV